MLVTNVNLRVCIHASDGEDLATANRVEGQSEARALRIVVNSDPMEGW